MNRERAKEILVLYRPGTADAGDPEVAAALAFARQDADLNRWVEAYGALQDSIRTRFKQIAVPEGLKEQIISERPAFAAFVSRRRTVVLAAAVGLVLLAGFVSLWWRPGAEDSLANYRGRMISTALRGYSMDLETNDLAQISAFLAGKQAPANYELPSGLRKAAAVGCATQKWQGAKVAMICFHTGKPLPPGDKGDLWLFVIDRASVKEPPAADGIQFTKVSGLITATWTQGDKLYLLGTEGDEQTIRQYL